MSILKQIVVKTAKSVVKKEVVPPLVGIAYRAVDSLADKADELEKKNQERWKNNLIQKGEQLGNMYPGCEVLLYEMQRNSSIKTTVLDNRITIYSYDFTFWGPDARQLYGCEFRGDKTLKIRLMTPEGLTVGELTENGAAFNNLSEKFNFSRYYQIDFWIEAGTVKGPLERIKIEPYNRFVFRCGSWTVAEENNDIVNIYDARNNILATIKRDGLLDSINGIAIRQNVDKSLIALLAVSIDSCRIAISRKRGGEKIHH